MGPVAIYGLTLAGAFLILLSRRVLIWSRRLLKQLQRLCDKHLHFSYAISRRRWIGPWTRLVVLRQTIMTTITLFVVVYRATDARSIVSHAGVASVVNMAPAYLAPHISYSADLFGLSLRTFRSLHVEIGVSMVLPTAIHIAAALKNFSTPVWAGMENQYGIIVCRIISP